MEARSTKQVHGSKKQKPSSETINLAVEKKIPGSSTNTCRSKKKSPQGPENTQASPPHFFVTLGPKIIPARTKKHVQVQKKVPRSKKHASPFEEDLQRYIFRGRRGIRDMFMFIRDVRRSGR